MAGVFVPAAEELLSKRVQELVLNNEEPPPLYICRDREDTTEINSSSAPSPIPVIDLSLLSASSTCTQEIQKLRSALSSWGCFQAVGHEIPASFLDEIRQVAKQFFKLPMEEKKKISKNVSDFEGYGADPTPEEGQPLDWSDRIVLQVYPEHQRNFNLWPENPRSFREILEEYTKKIKRVAEMTFKFMAKSLNLDENSFLNHLGDQASLTARFNYYSCCQRPDLVLGLKQHSDASALTFILQDEVGLQILKDNKWITVPKYSDTLVLLLGDPMEIMTNGIFKSPIHRVLSNLEMERISIAMFYNPAADVEIGPEDDLVNDENRRLFKNIKNYATTYNEYYNRGQRAIHTAQI